jgi:hypothetical protein
LLYYVAEPEEQGISLIVAAIVVIAAVAVVIILTGKYI